MPDNSSLPENIDQQKRDPKTLIYIKSFTPDTRQLLKKANEKAKEKQYKDTGCTIMG